MFDNQVGNTQDDHRPQHRLHRVGCQLSEIGLEIFRVALQVTYQRRKDILQTPTADHRIITRDEESRQHAHVSNQCPRCASSQLPIGTGCVGLSMTTHDKLAHHTRNAQQYHTSHIYNYKHGTTVLAYHIRKTPYITQTHCRTCCSQNDA